MGDTGTIVAFGASLETILSIADNGLDRNGYLSRFSCTCVQSFRITGIYLLSRFMLYFGAAVLPHRCCPQDAVTKVA